MGQLTRNEVFTLAVQKYSDAVYRAAIHNSRCTADAEDVVQDVYEKLLHYNGTFESEEHSFPLLRLYCDQRLPQCVRGLCGYKSVPAFW